NMLSHLWSKHRIDKDHPEGTNTNDSIIKAMHIITKQRQEKIAQLLVEFIIEDCQPFHILQSKAFCRLLNYMEPGFQIPCEKTVKKMIDKAYDWSCDQLFGIINMDGGYVNLMTDLWSSRTNQAYIGVTVTWINSNFELKKALLTIQLLLSLHTAKAIEDSLNQVITNWRLTGRVFCITTDNGANVKKAISLMDNITRSSCSAHTLQLSVLKGLKPAVRLIKRAKNLILFFSQSPKQSERLIDAQEKCRYPKIYQTIDDVPTRWNSSYLAWVRLKELQKAIDYLVLMLPSESERCDRLDGEYLKLINLTETEWRLLDNLISLLKPFYEATNIFSGSNYPTLNLIYPTMRLLIKKFAPSYEQSKDDYADLLFEPINRHEDDPESDIENEFDTLVIKKSTYNDSRFKGHRLIETPVTNEGLCDLVKAACFLSLKEYWEEDNHQPSVGLDELFNTSDREPATTNSLIAALYSNEELNDEIYNETEGDCYLREPIEKRGCDPLTWWKDRSEKYP
ncbi:10001_t:CDS:2, partial [Scutellospora calospora]